MPLNYFVDEMISGAFKSFNPNYALELRHEGKNHNKI